MFVDGVSWGIAPQSKVVDVGTYTVSFGDVADYITPADQLAGRLRELIHDVAITGVGIFPVTVIPGETVTIESIIEMGHTIGILKVKGLERRYIKD